MTNKRKRRRPDHKKKSSKAASTTKPREQMVYGESATTLLATIAKADLEQDSDGMVHGELFMEPDELAPLMRAMMRAEAELLVEDADDNAVIGDAARTPEQRRADAFLSTILAATAAVSRN